MPVEEAVNLFAANRRWMTRVLRGCVEADFGRAGQHSERGRMTLAELVAGLYHSPRPPPAIPLRQKGQPGNGLATTIHLPDSVTYTTGME